MNRLGIITKKRREGRNPCRHLQEDSCDMQNISHPAPRILWTDVDSCDMQSIHILHRASCGRSPLVQ